MSPTNFLSQSSVFDSWDFSGKLCIMKIMWELESHFKTVCVAGQWIRRQHVEDWTYFTEKRDFSLGSVNFHVCECAITFRFCSRFHALSRVWLSSANKCENSQQHNLTLTNKGNVSIHASAVVSRNIPC